jgi:hypothetical protein
MAALYLPVISLRHSSIAASLRSGRVSPQGSREMIANDLAWSSRIPRMFNPRELNLEFANDGKDGRRGDTVVASL